MVRSLRATAPILAAFLILAAQRPHGADAVQQPPRDTSAQRVNPTPPTGKIAGTVVTADTGKPVKRARVLASAVELPGGRAALTDERGSYELNDLPPGRYSVEIASAGRVEKTRLVVKPPKPAGASAEDESER